MLQLRWPPKHISLGERSQPARPFQTPPPHTHAHTHEVHSVSYHIYEVLQQATVIYGGKKSQRWLFVVGGDWLERGIRWYVGGLAMVYILNWCELRKIHAFVKTPLTLTHKINIIYTNYTHIRDLLVVFTGKWKLKPQWDISTRYTYKNG